MSKRAYGKYERRKNDFYPTPLKSVLPLVPFLRRDRITDFCEPCAGQGDLVRHLESFRLRCVYAGDIATGQDALDVPSFPAPVISNTPYPERGKPNVLVPLLTHFIKAAPFVWLLLKADVAHVSYSRPFWSQCSDIVDAKREAHIEGKTGGTENCCWYRFDRDHRDGPIFHNGDGLLASRDCTVCGDPFWPRRSDAKTCSDRCRKVASRSRIVAARSVTDHQPKEGP